MGFFLPSLIHLQRHDCGMEEDEIQAQVCKFPRVGNGSRNEEEDGEVGLRRSRGGGGSDNNNNGSTNRFHSSWHHSSRIIRVSRASGGKDRHSKVMTSKGLRDRRVRLSVTTAIQFYDLQDRLGYDQPSKAVEWLIKSASDAIAELPSLNNTFPDTPKQPSDEKRASVGTTTNEQGFDSADAEMDGGENNNYHHQQQNLSLSKSACSSTSETSKGSGLSLSRSDIRANRFKARERARELRAAKEKEKEKENNESHNNIAHHNHHHNNVNSISQTASFTELLTGGINGSAVHPTSSPRGGSVQETARQQWSSAPMDYFSSGLLGPSSSNNHQSSSSGGFSSVSQMIQLGHSHNSLADHHHQAIMSMSSVSPFSCNTGENQSCSDQMQQHFSFIPDHLMPAPVVTSSSHQQPSGNDYNLINFTISSTSGLAAGYNNRGTLQSNSPSLLPHLQRFSPIVDGSSTVPFFIGAAAAAPASAPPAMENNNNHHHHQFSSVFDGSRLHLCYGNACRHSDHKGKAKN